jgi:hypothetical protein
MTSEVEGEVTQLELIVLRNAYLFDVEHRQLLLLNNSKCPHHKLKTLKKELRLQILETHLLDLQVRQQRHYVIVASH